MARPSDGDASTATGRIETIVNTVQDGLYQLDPAGRFVMVNDVIVERSGYSRDELIGSHAGMLMGEADVERVEATIRQLLDADETDDTLEITVETATGDRIPHELKLSLLEEDGEFRGTVGTARDVSERLEYERRLEQQTAEVEAELDAVLGRASDAFFALDDEFRFRYVNEQAATVLERPAGELHGTDFWDVFPATTEPEEIQDAFHVAMDEGESQQLELYVGPLEIWIDATVYPSEIGISVYFRDVTDSKEHEQELERFRRRIEFALGVTSAAVWEWDFETDTITTHPDPDGLLGTGSDTIDEFLEQVHPADRARVTDALAEAIETGSGFPLEYRIYDGETIRWVEDYGELVGTDDAHGERLIGVAREITARKEHERWLQQHETAVNATRDGLAVIDSDGIFQLVNDAFAMGVGMSTDDIVGQSIDVLEDRGVVDESVLEAARDAALDLLLSDDEHVQFEATVDSPALGEIIVEANLTFLPPDTPDHLIGGAVVSIRPITERKRLKAQLQDRIEQQQAVAELGQAALETDDLDAFMQKAARTVADVLDNNYCEVLDLDQAADQLHLRQGVGWRSGAVGTATVPTDTDSQAGYTLLSEEPVIVEDLSSESRFTGPELLTSHDLASGITVLIGSTDEPWGVLGTHSTNRRAFTEYDANFVQSVANVIADVIERFDRERALEESERRYRTLVEHFPDGAVALFDDDLHYLAVGGELLEMLDVPDTDPPGQPIPELYPPEIVAEIQPYFESALEGERSVFEVEYLDRHFRAHTLPIEGVEGGVLAGMLMVQDVTEQRELEAALREREARYRDLFTSMTEGYCVIEKIHTPPDEPIDFRYVEANPAFEEHAGIDDVVGKTIREVVPDEPQEWFDLYEGVVQSREPVRFQRELATSDSILECYAFPVGDESDEQLGVIFTDVTERVERERFLEDAKSQLEAATEAGAVGTWEWHIPSDTFRAGPTMARIFGVDPRDAREGVPIERFTERIHESDHDRVMESVETATENCGEYRTEYRVWNAEGERRWVIARGHVECDERGEPHRLPGALTDITERKEYEQALTARNRLQEVLRGIWQAAVAADTQEAIEAQACDRLVELDPYIGALIGRADPVEQTIIPNAIAWADDTTQPSTDLADVHELVTTLADRALQRGRVQTSGGPGEEAIAGERNLNATNEDSPEPGFEEVAAIAAAPIVHEEIPHGALVICADEPDAFDGSGREIVAELGEILGLTIAALDRKEALVTDQLVEFEVVIATPFEPFEVPEEVAGTIAIEHVIPVGDDTLLQRGSARDGGRTTLEHLVEHDDRFHRLEFVESPETEDGSGRFELRCDAAPLFGPIISRNGQITRATLTAEELRIVARLAQAADIHGVVDDLRETRDDVEVTAKRHVSRAADPVALIESVVADDLTDRQRAVLEAAHASGYFDWPRQTTGEELAAAFDISPSTASQHLRLAQQKLLTAIFDGDTPSE